MAETFRDHYVAIPNREILGKGGMLEKIHELNLITARESGDKADAELVKQMAGEPEIMILCHLRNFDPLRHTAATAGHAGLRAVWNA